MNKQDLAKVILTGLALGITAGAVVWFLERFETARLHEEVRDYLTNYDKWREWMANQPQFPGHDG